MLGFRVKAFVLGVLRNSLVFVGPVYAYLEPLEQQFVPVAASNGVALPSAAGELAFAPFAKEGLNSAAGHSKFNLRTEPNVFKCKRLCFVAGTLSNTKRREASAADPV